MGGEYLYQKLSEIPEVKLYGPAIQRTGLAAFNVEGIHATDLAFFLDQEGIAIRSGHHCTQPLHARLDVAGSLRASVYFYNDKQDIDLFINKLKETIQMFSVLYA